MKVFIAQINPTIGDLAGNCEKVLETIKNAKELSADLVVFPEMCLSGYPPEDFLMLPHFIDAIEERLYKIAASSKEIAVIIGLPRHNPEGAEKRLFNSAAVIKDGAIAGYQDKMLLPTYDVFDERRYFEPGQQMGIWDIAGYKVGVTICEDIWQHSSMLKYTTYKRDPVSELIARHPDLVINISASPFSVGKSANRLAVCSLAARSMGCPLILCNQVGGNDSLIFDGYSLYLDKEGRHLMHAKGFEEDLMLVDISKKIQPADFSTDILGDLFRALVLGLRDYFKKSGFSKACLGLSGGIDSALTACIAKEALGAENVLAIAMPSRYSSRGSLTDAVKLAGNLGISLKEVSVEKPFQAYLDLLDPFFRGLPSDATEENLQARIRGMILMAFSNKLGYIVLSTGNKSELALGYATLYGDMCGGLGVISDLTKMQVYALSNWINRGEEVIPYSIIHKPPSAELRPNQKDSDFLPEYGVVDNVLQAYVEDHLSPSVIAEKFGYPLSVVNDLVQRIHRNEYKRRQSSPGLRISEKAFSVGRRFPIVQQFVR